MKLNLRTTLPAVALLALAGGCATLQQPPAQPVPVVQAAAPNLAQCVGWQAASTAWSTVQVYVSQVLEQQRALACTLPPPPPAQPTLTAPSTEDVPEHTAAPGARSGGGDSAHPRRTPQRKRAARAATRRKPPKDPGCCDEDSHAWGCENMCPEVFKRDGMMHTCDRTRGHLGKHSEGHESWTPKDGEARRART